MAPFPDTSYYLSGDYVSPTTSVITVAVTGLLGLLVMLFVAVGERRQAARRAKAAEAAELRAEKGGLEPGYAVVHGEVETADGGPALSMTIRQTGREYSTKNGLRHQWTELDRESVARPFVLRTNAGERVKVEPGSDMLLVDFLAIVPDPKEPGAVMGKARHLVDGRPLRIRKAQINPKDWVYACGELSGPGPAVAYRTAEEGFTLRPWARGSLRRTERMLVSSEPLEDRHVRRANLHGTWIGILVVAIVFNNWLSFGHYWLKTLWGRPLAATATALSTYTTQGKHGPIRHYKVTARGDLDGQDVALSSDVSYAFYAARKADADAGRSVAVPFVVTPKDVEVNNIGTEPVLGVFSVIVGWLLFLALSIGYFAHARHARPWYERKKVVDVGQGPLGYPDALA